MSIEFTLCGRLCDNVNFSCNKSRKKRKWSNCVKHIIQDVNMLLADSDFNRKYICNHILNKLVQLTGSEYGFIGKIVEEEKGPVLYTYAITNIAWDVASRHFLERCFKFDNMDTLFGDVITSGKYKIYNNYSMGCNNALLPHGHPIIKRFLGVPSKLGNKTVAMLGVCNKLEKYTKSDVKNIVRILNILSYLFIDLPIDSSNIQQCSFQK